MSGPARVILRPRRARPFFAGHPWVFDKSIDRLDGHAGPGDEVIVLSHEGRFIARGLYNPHSAIRVRLHRWDDASLDPNYFAETFDRTIQLREDLSGRGMLPLEASRLVSSEGDGVPGLTIDRYGDWLVAQVTSLGLARRPDLWVEPLRRRSGIERIWLRIPKAQAIVEGLEPANAPLSGTELPKGPLTIQEHKISYDVDLRSGQKTGFYLDQRDNRSAASRYAAGRRVLDLFCYGGGFALNALKHGEAVSAVLVDSSEPALNLARTHLVRNGLLERAEIVPGKVLDVVRDLAGRGERYGLVICDPPKFASRPEAVADALKGYIKLNRAVVEIVEAGGILVTCSCTGLVDRQMFQEVLGQVAEQVGRPIRILEQRGQPPDHPVNVSCLESEYLKVFICRVD